MKKVNDHQITDASLGHNEYWMDTRWAQDAGYQALIKTFPGGFQEGHKLGW